MPRDHNPGRARMAAGGVLPARECPSCQTCKHGTLALHAHNKVIRCETCGGWTRLRQWCPQWQRKES